MKMIEAINKIDSLKINTFSEEDKIGWLSTVDATIKLNIIDTHSDAEKVAFTEYNEATPKSTKLLAPAPYDSMYIYWLQAQIDYWSGDIVRYNSSIAMYNAVYDEFERYYNRTHAPKGRKMKFY